MPSSNHHLPRGLVVVFCLSGYLLCTREALSQHRQVPGSVGSSESTVTLGGWVHADYGPDAPSGVTVRLETNEGIIGGQQPVNASGYFEFLGLAKTYYRLTVTAPGFHTYQQDLDLRSVGDKLVVNVQLSPASEPKSSQLPAAHSFTDNNASKKARKEYEKGARALRERNLAAAQGHLEKSVDAYPCYARAQTDLALVLSQQRRLRESETALRKSLECDPDYLDAYNELGQLYYIEKKYEESKAILQEGSRRSPGSWQFYYQLGADDYRLGKYNTAEEEYLKAESLTSTLPAEIHVKLADVYLKQSALDKAYAEMQAYVQAEPQGRFAAELKGVIRRMESDGVVHAAESHDAPPSPPKP